MLQLEEKLEGVTKQNEDLTFRNKILEAQIESIRSDHDNFASKHIKMQDEDRVGKNNALETELSALRSDFEALTVALAKHDAARRDLDNEWKEIEETKARLEEEAGAENERMRREVSLIV